LASQIHKNLQKDHLRAYFLLKLIIFYYPAPDAVELQYLLSQANTWEAEAERKWAVDFVEQEPATAFERLRHWLGEILLPLEVKDRHGFITQVWQADERVPHVTEMQGIALMRLTQGWELQEALLTLLGKRGR
jgi:hypothetical protein